MALAHLVGPPNLDGYTPYERGHHFTAAAGETTHFIFSYSETLYLQGIRAHVDGNAQFGDYLTCEIIDHDNVLGYGVDFVLCTLGENVYCWPDMYLCRIDDALKDIPELFYIRHTYYSVEGATEDVNVVVHHVFRRVPGA